MNDNVNYPIILVTWQEVFKNLKDKFKGFDKALSKQYGKKRIKDFKISMEECIERTRGGDTNYTVGLDGSLLEPAILVLDIDNSEVGERIINLYNDDETRSLIKKIMGDPLVVKTPTKNHLHLYYKFPFDQQENLPFNNQNKLKSFKHLSTSRLGFATEYCYSQTTFAGPGYEIIGGPPLDQVSVLPPSLFPYNYVQKPVDKALTGLKRDLTKEGSRNESLFKFLIKENFSKDHVSLLNQICCDPPLPDKEVEGFSLLPARRGDLIEDGRAEEYYTTLTYEVFSFVSALTSRATPPVRLRDGEAKPIFTYKVLIDSQTLKKDTALALEDLGFNPDRAKNARLAKRTNEDTLLYVSLMENILDIFLEDEDWIGESVLGAACLLLLKTGKLFVKFIDDEQAYYIYNGSSWELSTENQLTSLVTRLSQSLSKFQNIGASTTSKPITSVIKTHCTESSWPTPTPGFNFKNGSLILLPQKLVDFREHRPQDNFRKLIKIDYEATSHLTPYEARFLLDFTNEQVIALNLLRCILYFCLEGGGCEVAAFISGAPGGSKTTLLGLIEKVVSGTSAITNINSLTQRFNLLSLVRSKNILFCSDLAPDSIKEDVAAVFKKIISGEKLSDEVRYEGNYQFLADTFLIFTSNFEPADFSAFNDVAFADRVIVTPAPTIAPNYRINNFVEILSQTTNNFAGIINWALNMSAEFPQKINRATSVNTIIAPATNLVDTFILERLVYKPESFISIKDLTVAFNNFVKDNKLNATERSRKRDTGELGVRSFARLLRKFIENLTEETPIIDDRNSKKKGFKNLAFRNDKASGQIPFAVKGDPALLSLLNSDPFKNHGVLLRDNSKTFVQAPANEPNTELLSKAGVKAVSCKSSKDIIEGRESSPDLKNHSQIIPSMTEVGDKIYNLPFWASFPESKPEFPQNKVNLLSDNGKSPFYLPPKDNSTQDLAESTSLVLANNSAQDLAESRPEGATNNSETELAESRPESAANNSETELVELKPTVRTKKKNLDLSQDVTPEELAALKRGGNDTMLTFSEVFEAGAPYFIADQKDDGTFEPKKGWRVIFEESRETFVCFARLLEDPIKKNPLTKYKSYDKLYASWETVQIMRQTFSVFPLLGAYGIIKHLNLVLFDRVYETFDIVKKFHKPDKNDYFSRALPGTNTQNKEIKNFKTSLKALIEDEKSSPLVKELKNSNFTWDGKSLLPILYVKGDKFYGRLKSLPPSNLSTFKSELKATVLKTMTKYSGLRFVELDMRAAHTVVFKALTNLKPEESAKFPTVDKLWGFLVNSFKNNLVKQKETSSVTAFALIERWSDQQIKDLIKTQWYKALNSGSLYNLKNVLESNKNKLNLSQKDFGEVSTICQTVFQQIDLLKVLKKFQEDVNQKDYIWLPTESTPFDTKTPSKRESGKKSKQTAQGTTGMSRLFSSCELVLIMLTYIALAKIENIVPIAYEADGLLLAGFFEDPDKLLEEINQVFAPEARRFMDEEFSLEFKNIT